MGDVLSLLRRNSMLPLYVIVGVFHNRSVAKTGTTQGPVKRLGRCIECCLLVANSELMKLVQRDAEEKFSS